MLRSLVILALVSASSPGPARAAQNPFGLPQPAPYSQTPSPSTPAKPDPVAGLRGVSLETLRGAQKLQRERMRADTERRFREIKPGSKTVPPNLSRFRAFMPRHVDAGEVLLGQTDLSIDGRILPLRLVLNAKWQSLDPNAKPGEGRAELWPEMGFATIEGYYPQKYSGTLAELGHRAFQVFDRLIWEGREDLLAGLAIEIPTAAPGLGEVWRLDPVAQKWAKVPGAIHWTYRKGSEQEAWMASAERKASAEPLPSATPCPIGDASVPAAADKRTAAELSKLSAGLIDRAIACRRSGSDSSAAGGEPVTAPSGSSLYNP